MYAWVYIMYFLCFFCTLRLLSISFYFFLHYYVSLFYFVDGKFFTIRSAYITKLDFNAFFRVAGANLFYVRMVLLRDIFVGWSVHVSSSKK